jgi:phage baseplate assembly protein W
MTMSRDRAWRFVHPDFDVADAATGIQNSATGSIAMVEGAASVRQSILLLLSIKTGERLMRPEYGTDLQRLIFSPNDDTTAGLAIHYVTKAVARWEPRAEIVQVLASRNPQRDSLLDLTLEYRLRATGATGQLAFSLDLTGGVS